MEHWWFLKDKAMVSGKKATLLVIKLFLTYITAWTRSPSAPSEWKILFVHGTAVQQRTWWKKTSPYYIFSKTWLWLILHRYAPCNFVAAILFATFERVFSPSVERDGSLGQNILLFSGTKGLTWLSCLRDFLSGRCCTACLPQTPHPSQTANSSTAH